MLGADLIEALLDGKAHEQGFIDAGKAVVGAQGVLIPGEELDVVVSAGDQEEGLILGIALGKCDQGVAEDLVVFQIRLDHLDGDDLAVGGGGKASLADGDRGDAEGFVEGAGHAVNVHVAAQKPSENFLSEFIGIAPGKPEGQTVIPLLYYSLQGNTRK